MGAGRIITAIAVLCFVAAPVQAGGNDLRGHIAYASDGSIFVSSADGSARKRLTRSENDMAPSWSPDGRRVAFLRSEDDGVDLYVVDASGGSETKLADNVDLTFDWSPGGGRIAFSSTGSDLLPQSPHLFVVNVGSGVVEQLTSADRADVSPEWSPDGRSLAFVGSPPRGVGAPESPDSDIYRLNVATGAVNLLTQHRDPDYGPTWSPDGRQIAFSSTRDAARDSTEPAPEIYVMDARGRDERRLTFRRSAHDVAPQWSPDGDRISFLEYRGDAQEAKGHLRVMRADGSFDRVLTEAHEVMAWDPTWSPSGRTIVFIAGAVGADGVKGDTEVAYLDVATGAISRLTDNTRFEWGPDWR